MSVKRNLDFSNCIFLKHCLVRNTVDLYFDGTLARTLFPCTGDASLDALLALKEKRFFDPIVMCQQAT